MPKATFKAFNPISWGILGYRAIEDIDRTYGIHYWWIFRSSYRKLTFVGFELTTTKFCSKTDWAIRLWVEQALRANFVLLLHFYLFVQYSHFILAIAFVSHHIYFKWNLTKVITLVVEWIDTYSIHHWRIFRSSYRKLAWVEFEPKTYKFHHELSSHEFDST